MAKERGLTYVKLDGDIGILGNGAGLVMSTLDVVAQAGGAPANFLDAGGGSKAEAITSAVEVILSNANVKAVLFNIFGGITRCDEVAKGLIEAFDADQADGPVRRPARRHQRRGGPARCSPRRPAQRAHGGDDARGRREGRGAAPADEHPRRQRHAPLRLRHHRPRGHVPRAQQPALRHATSSSGVTPGKGGQDVEGIPVFNTFHDAVDETGANTAMIFVPPRFAADSILEAADAGIALIIAITEGIPAHDELRVYNHLSRRTRTRAWSARTAPASCRRARPTSASSRPPSSSEGNVGVVSRSGTLTYQIGNELAQRGFGNSSIVGIGGDPVPGSSFIDIIAALRGRPGDRADRDGGRDRRLRRGGGGRVHRRAT